MRRFSTTDIAIVLFCSGGLLPAMSFSNYFEMPAERTIFKAVGSVALLISTFLLFKNRKFNLKSINSPGAVLSMVPFALLALSAAVWDFSGAIPIILRLIVALIIYTFLTNLKISELILVLKIFILFGLVLSIIAILEMALGLSRAEKIPVLNWHTSKSIVFEQNVFGIYLYLCIFAQLCFGTGMSNPFRVGFLIAGVLSSYYRTVYALLLLRCIFRFPVSAIFVFIVSMLAVSYWGMPENLSSILKADQFASASGRDALWRIGLTVFFESPLLGLSELSIPSVSNEVLNRNPPFTTYHNVLIDLASSGGLFALFSYLGFGAYCFMRAVGLNKVTVLFIFAPALFNTFIPFAPNMLGILSGALLVMLCNLYKGRESDFGQQNGR